MHSLKKEKKRKGSVTSSITVEHPINGQPVENDMITVSVGCGSSGFTTTICPPVPFPCPPPQTPTPTPEEAAAAVSEHLRRHGRLIPPSPNPKFPDKKTLRPSKKPSLLPIPSCTKNFQNVSENPSKLAECSLSTEIPLSSFDSHTYVSTEDKNSTAPPSRAPREPATKLCCPTKSQPNIEKARCPSRENVQIKKSIEIMKISCDLCGKSNCICKTVDLQLTKKLSVPQTSGAPLKVITRDESVSVSSKDPDLAPTENNVTTTMFVCSCSPEYTRLVCQTSEESFPLDRTFESHSCISQASALPVAHQRDTSSYREAPSSNLQQQVLQKQIENPRGHHALPHFVFPHHLSRNSQHPTMLPPECNRQTCCRPVVEVAQQTSEVVTEDSQPQTSLKSVSGDVRQESSKPLEEIAAPKETAQQASSKPAASVPSLDVARQSSFKPNSETSEKATSSSASKKSVPRVSHSAASFKSAPASTLQISTTPGTSYTTGTSQQAFGQSLGSRISEDSKEEDDEDGSVGILERFPLLFLMQLHSRTPPETLQWLIERMQCQQKEDGAELLVVVVLPLCNTRGGVRILIGATTRRLLEAAENLSLSKWRKDNRLAVFYLEESDLFIREGETAEDILSTAEKQRILLHLLRNLRNCPEDKFIPGRPDLKLCPNEAIVLRSYSEKFIERIYPLHDPKEMKKICDRWWIKIIIDDNLLHALRAYFGEAIAFHLAFLAFMGKMALIHGILGTILFIFGGWPSARSWRLLVMVAINVIVGLLFPMMWRRRSCRLAYRWGVLRSVNQQHIRSPSSWISLDEICEGCQRDGNTGVCVFLRMILFSLPVLTAFLFLNFWILMQFLELERTFEPPEEGSTLEMWMRYHALFFLYAVLLWNLSWIGRQICKACNAVEGHVGNEREPNVAFKWIVVLYLVNFSAIGHYAFFSGSIKKAGMMLMALLIVTAFMNFISKRIFKFILRESSLISCLCSTGAHTAVQTSHYYEFPDTGICTQTTIMDSVHFEATPASRDERLYKYNKTLEDNMDGILFFGMAFLFSAAFPMASFLVLLNLFIIIQSDAYLLCRKMQRPLAKNVKNFGYHWQGALDLAAIVVLIINCALLSVSTFLKDLIGREISPGNWFLIFILLEHVIMALKLYMDFVIRDCPSDIREQIEELTVHTT